MDEKIFHLINEQWTNPAFDLFMPLISYAEIWTPFFLIAAVALLIFGGFRGRAFVFCTALTLGLSNAAVDPLKHAIGRPRPKQVQTVRMIELEKTRPMILTIFKKPHVRVSTAAERARSGASFPSGHTNNNTVIAICCTIFYRRWGKLYWIIAAAVAYSTNLSRRTLAERRRRYFLSRRRGNIAHSRLLRIILAKNHLPPAS